MQSARSLYANALNALGEFGDDAQPGFMNRRSAPLVLVALVWHIFQKRYVEISLHMS